MATKLLELWIIDRSGLSLVHIQSELIKGKPGISPVLFSGFLTAVESMAAESIESIKMKDSKILILPITTPAKFFVVGRAKIREKESSLRKVLIKVGEVFIEEFGAIIRTWGGDHQLFAFFEEKVTRFFET